MFCCALICVLSSFAIILMGKRELVALLCLSSWYRSVAILHGTVCWSMQYVIVIHVFSGQTYNRFNPYKSGILFVGPRQTV